MENLKEQLSKLVELMGFNSSQLEVTEETRLLSITIEDEFLNTTRLPSVVLNLNRIARLMAKKMGIEPVVVDVNNYRRERERLIIELAKAAARRAIATKESVNLPAMNAYERRLIHAELSMRPDVATESVGEGKDRFVVVKAI
ncbi:MAG: hypothetical protein A3D47_01535 [Candidatus Colwellbacteria bacterium RIFCSPHIGHO2_02_FULL_43_15]|uniref:R3H domain-containing protein n=3 Tax=Candidatus Colwelliibacteriota TaxID=1817904 RepID=A0A1G1Z0B6_9BACT|nr:MAG: hypothetical protein A3D47_01535 [Candidatus Colwellbacteria bacterium RIFCSPHIGHO2_02_FULL_43_15]OGY60951.1 MAG: hypothetical protein A3F99_00860 [Candidatus Colwellbacteria bacterium RIFCSPLOWO2_12_FULL_43_11]